MLKELSNPFSLRVIDRKPILSNIKHNFKKLICSFCVVICFFALHVHSSELPPDPDNAALLYYQALSLWSDIQSSYTDTDTAQEPNDNSNSRPTLGNTKFDIDELIAIERKMEREYERKFGKKERESRRKLKRNLTIQIVEAASRIPRCTWGIYHSKDWGLSALGLLRHLVLLLDDDAQALAAAGDYRMALERCLAIRRFARHLGDESIDMHNMSLSTDGVAFSGIRYVLGLMPPDAETIAWLKNQLAATPGATESFVPALEIDFELALQRLQSSPKTVARIRNRLMEQAGVVEEKGTEDGFKSLTDEKLIPVIQEQASKIFSEFFTSVSRAIESDKPYNQTHKELEVLTYKLRKHDELVPFYDLTYVAVTPRFYNLHANHRTMTNAVEAAIEIYLIVAKTGQLPKILPGGLPKDPFTGQDFVYEITNEGFALRCQGEEFLRSLNRKLEFKVHN